ncbi:hypothetical protein [Paraglaciecola sp. L3A3]|uniref:hypothetical protein n=1 Tax=Paraglaciecola sp. L3A3 TaxID=2686358 RepID=UPI00131DD8E0|nr:hypothetical protein [Paraglaciecola sp. L3A3]
MNVAQRNERAKQYVIDKLDLASDFTESDFQNIPNYDYIKSILLALIFVPAKGFRGVVATAITGKYLNPNYDPLNDFYSCNPRSIFEQGIFYAFENRIPCGKSDPLNVAKNINVLDDAWAKGKRPQASAQAAVDYLHCIEAASNEEQEDLINYFFFKLVEYANSIASIQIIVPDQQELANQVSANKLLEFVLRFPESGTIPQLVVSKLMKKLYSTSTVVVEGGDESVFGTNTTSKKPADIWLESSNTPYNLFEVTVKKIDAKRLDDCIQSLHSVGMLEKQVSFVCRIPEDINSLSGVQNGALNYKGKQFNFVEIRSFILSMMAFLSAQEVHEVMLELQSFISQIERPITTRNGWNSIFC